MGTASMYLRQHFVVTDAYRSDDGLKFAVHVRDLDGGWYARDITEGDLVWIYSMTVAASPNDADWLSDGLLRWIRDVSVNRVIDTMNDAFGQPYPASEEGHRAIIEHLWECLNPEDGNGPLGIPARIPF